MTVVCMACLEGVNGRAIVCRFCNQRWDGSSLVLGTMYSYDIFAAMPCCTERIKVSFTEREITNLSVVISRKLQGTEVRISTTNGKKLGS